MNARKDRRTNQKRMPLTASHQWRYKLTTSNFIYENNSTTHKWPYKNIPPCEVSTVNIASLFAVAYCSPAPVAVTFVASDSWICWTAANFCVVLVFVTVSTTTCDCSGHAVGRPGPSYSTQISLHSGRTLCVLLPSTITWHWPNGSHAPENNASNLPPGLLWSHPRVD